MREIRPAIYIMANKRNGTLYTGVTSNLIQRVYQHKHDELDGFTKRYGCKILAYYEQYDDMYEAITREKQIKGGSRKKKLLLIEKINPNWEDLYESLLSFLDCFTRKKRGFAKTVASNAYLWVMIWVSLSPRGRGHREAAGQMLESSL